ncbi:MAG: hypothetical protein V1647_02700 [Pseudomonadota bacterium]
MKIVILSVLVLSAIPANAFETLTINGGCKVLVVAPAMCFQTMDMVDTITADTNCNGLKENQKVYVNEKKTFYYVGVGKNLTIPGNTEKPVKNITLKNTPFK